MFLVPKSGLTVIDPATNKPLPAEGKPTVGNATYWHRRLVDGDVTTPAAGGLSAGQPAAASAAKPVKAGK